MNSKKQLPLENGLFTLAFLLALGVRLLNLGAAPLSNLEADIALQAWDLSRGVLPGAAAHPLYITLTSLSFALLGSSNFVARMWPALLGSMLALLPLIVRHKLGRKVALVLVFGIALDPTLVALARLVNGPMLAMTLTALTLALVSTRRPIWSGICAGLALLSGPGVWVGLLSLALAWGAARLARIRWDAESPSQESAAMSPLQAGLISAAATLILIGTRFFTYPAGVGALATSLGIFLGGGSPPAAFSMGRMLASLVTYAPLGLIFALAALLGPRLRSRRVAVFGLWALAAFALALLYPGRNLGVLAWMLIPVWGMAAVALGVLFDDDLRHPIIAGQAAAWFVFLALAWMTLAGLHLTLPEGHILRWLILLGILGLGGLSTAFVGLGWSWQLARSGTFLGLLAALAVYSIAVLVGATQTRPDNPVEFFAMSPTIGQADLLLKTLNDLAIDEHGLPTYLEIVALVDDSAMRWLLRDFSEARYAPALAEAELPPVVIAPQSSESEPWVTAYRGQNFAWSLSPGWDGAMPTAWVDWFIFRNAPFETEYLILWARGDLFPDQVQPEETLQENE